MTTTTSTSSTRPVGPYCRAFRRGSLGDAIDGRSREGRYLRKIEAELVAHVGGAPSFTQTMLIRRCARAMLRLELLDQKMTSGNWTDHDGRVFGGLNNAVRLGLRELGLRPTPPKQPSLAEVLASAKGRYQADDDDEEETP
jgi:hypothetical protein